MYTLLGYLAYHRGLLWYARTLYHLIGVEYLLLCMLSLFPLYAVVIEQFLVFRIYGRHVRYEHVEALFLCQHGCSRTAFASS